MREEISQLLVLQDRDMVVADLEAQIKHVPHEVGGLEKRIAEIKSELEAQAKALKDLEVDRSRLENEVRGFEDQMVKYKNQQLMVKKNDEYDALNQQMYDLKKHISEHEDSILERMEEIDEMRSKNQSEAEQLNKRIQLFEKEIAALKEREQNLNQQLTQAQTDASDAEGKVEAEYLKSYHRVRAQKIRYPLVATLDDGRCNGCHIRVSQEVISSARDPKRIAFCDSCGRIVFS